jgi:hypothetical protein
MKKLLIFLMLLSATSVFAQDVIVKKDGSTILSKVIEIGTYEVKYKKHSNQNGPTYTISKSEIQSINYENGEKEDITQSKIVAQNKPSYVQEDPNMLRKKFEAEDLYKEARTLNIWSWVCVVAGAGGGVTGLILCKKDKTLQYITLGGGLAVCCGLGGGLAGLASKKKSQAKSLLSSATILNYDLKIGDYTLSPSVNLLTDNQTLTPHVGLGFKFDF